MLNSGVGLILPRRPSMALTGCPVDQRFHCSSRLPGRWFGLRLKRSDCHDPYLICCLLFHISNREGVQVSASREKA
jgi:hypothetical protein